MNPIKIRNLVLGQGMPKICVPIVGKTKEEILSTAKEIKSTQADLVEWRVDWFDDVFDFSSVENVLKELRNVLGDMPLLMTFRTSKEGGEKSISDSDYVALCKNAAAAGLIDLLDVELFTGDDAVREVIDTAHQKGVKVIVSNHDFFKTPSKEEIIERLVKMQELGADIPKIAVMPESKDDVLTLLSATQEMNEKYGDRPIITMSMSKDGVISRLTGEFFGSCLTFGALGKVSAPGQISVNKLHEILVELHAVN